MLELPVVALSGYVLPAVGLETRDQLAAVGFNSTQHVCIMLHKVKIRNLPRRCSTDEVQQKGRSPLGSPLPCTMAGDAVERTPRPAASSLVLCPLQGPAGRLDPASRGFREPTCRVTILESLHMTTR